MPAYLRFILDVIVDVGPIDVHHEHQICFLRDFADSPREISFFTVDKTDAALAALLARYPGVQQDANRRQTGRASPLKPGYIRQMRRSVKQRFFAKSMSPQHLLFNEENGFGPMRYGSSTYFRGASAFYQDVKAAATTELDTRIAEIYDQDKALFKRVAEEQTFAHLPLTEIL